MWDFGSAAKHHQLYNPWLDYSNAHADGDPHAAAPRRRRPQPERRSGRHLHPARRHQPAGGMAERSPRKIKRELELYGLLDEPLGVDVIEMPVLAALQQAGHHRRRRPAGVPGGPADQDPRRDPPAHPGLLDGRRRLRQPLRVPAARGARERVRRPGRQDALRPGLGVRRRRQRDLRRAVRTAPARLLRPHRPAGRPGVLRHPAQLQRLPDLLLPHLRGRVSASVGPARRVHPLPRVHGRGDRLVRPGATTADIVSVWPTAQEFGFPDEEAAFALQYGHGVGLSIWEKPIFSRLVSLEHPEVLEEGMVFALETYWPSADGMGRRPHRGGAGGHRRRLRGDHQVPGRGAAGRRAAVLHRRRSAADRARLPVPPEHRGRPGLQV